MGFIAWIVVGLIAGWLTGKIMKGSGYGFFVDILLGLAGAMVGGFIAQRFLLADDNILQATTGQQPFQIGVKAVEAAVDALKGQPVEKKLSLPGVLLTSAPARRSSSVPSTTRTTGKQIVEADILPRPRCPIVRRISFVGWHGQLACPCSSALADKPPVPPVRDV